MATPILTHDHGRGESPLNLSRLSLCAAVSLLLLAPVTSAHDLIRGAEGTYLDFSTFLVHDGDGRVLGASSPDAYSSAGAWVYGEPMRTTAVAVGVSISGPPTTIEVYRSDAGVCLHVYCIAAEVIAWGPATAYLTWQECTTTACKWYESPFMQKGDGPGRLLWTGGFDPTAKVGTVAGPCLFVNGVPAEATCVDSVKWWAQPPAEVPRAPHLPRDGEFILR